MSGYPWNPLPPNGDGKPTVPAGPNDIPFRKPMKAKDGNYVKVPKFLRKNKRGMK